MAFLAGLGAVLADVLMAGIAAYGIQSIAHLILDYAKYLQIAGGLLLIVLGISTARTHFAASDLDNGPHSARFGLTFCSRSPIPGLVLGYLAIFSSMSGIWLWAHHPTGQPLYSSALPWAARCGGWR